MSARPLVWSERYNCYSCHVGRLRVGGVSYSKGGWDIQSDLLGLNEHATDLDEAKARVETRYAAWVDWLNGAGGA